MSVIDETREVAETWAEELAHLDDDQFKRCIRGHLAGTDGSQRFWPTHGDLLKHAPRHTPLRLVADNDRPINRIIPPEVTEKREELYRQGKWKEAAERGMAWCREYDARDGR